MNFKDFFSTYCFLLLLIPVQAQQDSLLGYAATHEAYRNISMEKRKLTPDKEFIEPLEIQTIQQEVLEEGQALLEYFISDSKICIFFISKNDFQKKIIPKDFPLENWVNLIAINLVNPNFSGPDFNRRNESFVDKSYLLYEKIFAPLEKFNLPKKLLIKPDGILKTIPFEIFLTNKPTDILDYENHDYLFQKHQISYCHSTMIQQQAQKAKSLAPKLFMTFAPKKTLEIQKEAITIYRKFGGDIYQNQAATPVVLKQEAPLFQALHFPSICEEELAKLPELNAQMVVFSNCQKEEKPFPLVHQLMKKGSKSVMTNLWKTTPENNLDFLKNFYHHIYQKKDKDAALQRAKKDALRWTTGVNGHPHFWANHLVFGDIKSVDLQGFRIDLWLWFGLVLMLFFGVAFINRNVI